MYVTAIILKLKNFNTLSYPYTSDSFLKINLNKTIRNKLKFL